jgi:hypothetical protein
MGGELEAAGDLVTAGLIAHEIDGKAGSGAAHAHSANCANCGAHVSAHYCGNCGQKGHLHSSVLHLVEELIHGLFHFETKGWRTLPLLVFRPGELTKRYIDGQRTRFVSPLALFLFMMFLMFFVFSLTMGKLNHGSSSTPESSEQAHARLEKKIAERKEAFEEAEMALKVLEPGSKDAIAAQAAVDKAKKKLEATEMSMKALAAGGAIDSDSKWDWKKELKGSQSNTNINTYSDIPWINEAIRHAVENPELALYKLKNAAYKYAFLLIPISMPFLWLMFFWKRGVTMFHHAVFSLYSLSFMSLLFVLIAIAGYFDFSGTAASLFAFVPPIHMFLQLRGAYGLSRGEALWRTCALMLMSFIALTVYSLAILALTIS